MPPPLAFSIEGGELSILIISQPTDVHALAVSRVLGQRGYDVHRVCEADFPQQLLGSFDPDVGYEFRNPRLCSADEMVVWNRRRQAPVPHPSLHVADRRLAMSVGADFLRSWHDLQQGSWVNTPIAAERAERKTVQLAAARKVGLKLPRTLVSNDHLRIRDFVRTIPRVIVKPMTIMSWDTGDQWIGMTTTRVTEDDLWDPVAVEACPMIYQAEVAKKSEYRVVIFGSEATCIEIDSQAVSGAELDWRDVKHRELAMRQVELPESLRASVMGFMDEMGLVHGSIDLIHGLDDEIYFLEVNQQGQFLWLEEVVPSLNLLGVAAEFLAAGGAREFRSRGEYDDVSYDDYVRSGAASEDIEASASSHIAETRPRIIRELDYA